MFNNRHYKQIGKYVGLLKVLDLTFNENTTLSDFKNCKVIKSLINDKDSTSSYRINYNGISYFFAFDGNKEYSKIMQVCIQYYFHYN